MKKFSLAALLASALFVSCQSTPEGYKIEGEVEGVQEKHKTYTGYGRR